jgi:HKD family nuclease
MSKKIVFQGVTGDSHLAAVKQLLSIPNPDKILFSIAFMNQGGLWQIEDSILPLADRTTIIAGIRNGITSAQGLLAAIGYGCTTYAVDTGSRNVIFHPKIYFSRNADEARLILGSANLTIGGLSRNIEASISMTLDLSCEEDAEFVADIENKISAMIDEYQEHVFVVPDQDAVGLLLAAGRVVDESIVAAPTPGGSSGNRDLDTISKMRLKTTPIRRPVVTPVAPVASVSVPVPAVPVRKQLHLVWESGPLVRRDLTIPTGANTNSTGSMLFKKGAMENIDQRHYFRNEVFSALNWQKDTAAKTKHIERAEAKFRLIIRDVNYGVFTLKLSHNSKTDTASYRQGNSMMSLHWGDARPLIAREDLLGRVIWLYRAEIKPGIFVLEID